MSNIEEQLKRERTRAIVVAGIELVLGITMVYIGWQFFNASDYFKITIAEMEKSPYTPKYMIDFLKTVLSATLAGGVFALVHGIKRILDNFLNAWVKSAIPKTSTE